MRFSAERLSAALAELTQRMPVRVAGYCVGLSGGLDSAVLLHALVSLQRAGVGSPLRVLHVDHALLPDSAAWASRCERLADAYGTECAVLRIDARPRPGESPEAAAREARYAALAGALRPDEALLTAHHADDQLETVLLQLFRGGGLRGLAAMPRSARLGRGWHLRPLLEFERAELLAWARHERLDWIEDPSNVNARFDRNYLRHDVLPAVRARWPSVARTVARTAGYAAEAAEI
jgi:tRNA(Ile)-lysidine synthase